MARLKKKSGNHTNGNGPLKMVADGRVSRPKSSKVILANKSARRAHSTGETAKEMQNRRNDRDSKTLYVKFKGEEKPTSPQEIFSLHKDIKDVRVTRQGNKSKKGVIDYCFVEFGSDSECQSAKTALALKEFKGGQIYVDFMGTQSAKGTTKRSSSGISKGQLNPCRLAVSGIDNNLTAHALKKHFRGAKECHIPSGINKKAVGFVSYRTPGEAKVAFDASQKLEINGKRVTVVFAKISHLPGKKEDTRNSDDEDVSNDESSEDEEMKDDEDSEAEEEGSEEEDKDVSMASKTSKNASEGEPEDEDEEEEESADEEAEGEEGDSEGGEDEGEEDEAEDEGGEDEGGEDEEEDIEEEEDGSAEEEEGEEEEGEDEEESDDDEPQVKKKKP